jgi:large subunit ribosomal protein L28
MMSALEDLERRRRAVIQPMTKGRRCFVCGKGPIRGEQITRRGLAKKAGGVGRKITGRKHRSYKPNLQKVRALVDGKATRIKVCTSCIRSGKVRKPAAAGTPA